MKLIRLLILAVFSLGCVPEDEPQKQQTNDEKPAVAKSVETDTVPSETSLDAQSHGLEEAVWVTAGAYKVTNEVFRRLQIFKDQSSVPDVDRWDGVIYEAAGKNRRLFLYTKTFVHVESHGNPFVVSATGCAGLMQFCFQTAKEDEFELVFNTEEIHKCRCRSGRCKVSRDTSKKFEDVILYDDHHMIDKKSFPCDREDPRFNPFASIEAGVIFVDNLRKRFRGNLYLMYVAYNSGPAIAREIFKKLGRNGRAKPSQIEPHLKSVLKRRYGKKGLRRADALLKIQFPKLRKTFRIYSHQPIFHGLTPQAITTAWASK